MSGYFYSLKTLEAKEPARGIRVKSVYLDKAMMTYMEFEPRATIPEHKHEHEQITIVLEGKMDMTVGNVRKNMARGDIVAVPPNVLHGAEILDQFTVAVDAWSPARDDYK